MKRKKDGLFDRDRYKKTKTEALKEKRDLLNKLEKDGAESFVGDRTRFAYLARKFREEKLIPAVYVGEKKIAGRRELSAPRSWLLQLEYYFGGMKLPSITVGEIKKFEIWLSKIPARSTIVEDENGKLVLNIKENGGQRGIESINRAVELLRTVLNYAVEEKMLREEQNPFSKKKARSLIDRRAETKREQLPTFGEEMALLDVAVATHKKIDLVFHTQVFKLKRDMRKRSRDSASSSPLRQNPAAEVNDETHAHPPTTLCGRPALARTSATGDQDHSRTPGGKQCK